MVWILKFALFLSPLLSLIFYQNEDFLNPNLHFMSSIKWYICYAYIHVVFFLCPPIQSVAFKTQFQVILIEQSPHPWNQESDPWLCPHSVWSTNPGADWPEQWIVSYCFWLYWHGPVGRGLNWESKAGILDLKSGFMTHKDLREVHRLWMELIPSLLDCVGKSI